MFDLGLVGGKVYADGAWKEWNIYVSEGKIAALGSMCLAARHEFCAKGMFVLPGLIDPHVHLAMPAGVLHSADDFASGSRLAVSGGVTTLVDFLDESSTAAEMRDNFSVRKAAAGSSITDYSFHASLKSPQDNAEIMVEASLELGLPTIKTYTTYDVLTPDRYLADILQRSAGGDILMLCHAERDSLLRYGKQGEDFSVKRHGEARPPLSEIEQVLSLAAMTQYYQGYCYVVHVSCGTTLAWLREKYAPLLGKHLFLESCPHYFLLDDSLYTRDDAALYAMCPPLRKTEEQTLLRELFSMVDVVATDHCPFLYGEKTGESFGALSASRPTAKPEGSVAPPMGVGGLGLAFQQLYALFGDRVIDKFTKNPAKVHGLYPRKGTLEPGSDADIAVFQKVLPTDEPFVRNSFSHCDYTIYDRTKETLRTKAVFCGGEQVFLDGAVFARQGQFLRRALRNT